MILAVIHLIPIACYGALAIGGGIATWLANRPPKKKKKEKEKKENEKVQDDIYDDPDKILSQDLLAPIDKSKEPPDNYPGDDRFELLDL